MSSQGFSGREVQVLGDPGPILMEGFGKTVYPFPRFGEVMDIEVDIEKIDVPRCFYVIHNVGLHNLSCNRQRRLLGYVMDITIAGFLKLFVLFEEKPRAQLACESV